MLASMVEPRLFAHATTTIRAPYRGDVLLDSLEAILEPRSSSPALSLAQILHAHLGTPSQQTKPQKPSLTKSMPSIGQVLFTNRNRFDLPEDVLDRLNSLIEPSIPKTQLSIGQMLMTANMILNSGLWADCNSTALNGRGAELEGSTATASETEDVHSSAGSSAASIASGTLGANTIANLLLAGISENNGAGKGVDKSGLDKYEFKISVWIASAYSAHLTV